MGGVSGMSVFSSLGRMRLKLRFDRLVSGVQAGLKGLTEPLTWRIRYVLLCRLKLYYKKTGGFMDEYLER